MNNYWKAACIVGLVLTGFAGGWYVNGKRHDQQIAELKQEYADQQAKAEEQIRQKEKAYQEEIQQQADKYQTAISSSNADMNKLRTELKNVQKNNPITCRIGADRLSIIKQASQRANN